MPWRTHQEQAQLHWLRYKQATVIFALSIVGIAAGIAGGAPAVTGIAVAVALVSSASRRYFARRYADRADYAITSDNLRSHVARPRTSRRELDRMATIKRREQGGR